MSQKSKYISLLVKAVNNHAIYLWGAQGQKVNKDLTEDIIRKMETSEENANRVIRHIQMLEAYGWLTSKTKAYDCSGLVCYCLIACGREAQGFDATADQLFHKYPKVAILREGCLIHRKGHIATYIGYGYLIEDKGRDYGVVVSPFKADEWDKEYAYPFND